MKELSLSKNEILVKMHDIELFQYFNNIEKERLLFASEVLEFDYGEKIIEQGDISAYLYVILDGKVNINLEKADGSSVYIDSSAKGEILGEASIFINVKRTANVIAASKVLMIQIERNSLINFMKNNPEAGLKMQMVIIYSLLQRLKDSNQELAFERKNTMKGSDMSDMMKLVGK